MAPSIIRLSGFIGTWHDYFEKKGFTYTRVTLELWVQVSARMHGL